MSELIQWMVTFMLAVSIAMALVIQIAAVRACFTVYRLTAIHEKLRLSQTTPVAWKPFLRPSFASLPPLSQTLFRAIVFVPFGFISMLVLVVVAGKVSRCASPVTALRIGRFCGKIVGWIAGVRKVEFRGRPADTQEAPLVVANHLSWIDFIILGSTTRFGFVIGEAVSTVPVIGKGFMELGELVGCIVLDRRCASSREATKLRIKEKLHALKASGGSGHRLVVFSEGTLTNGESVVPLKLGAFEALVPSQPLRIELSNPHYSLASLKSIESICLFLSLPGTDVTMTWCEVVNPRIDETVEDFAERVRLELVKGSKISLAKTGSYRDHLQVCDNRNRQ